MSEVVLDSSIALTWCFEDEASLETDELFERVRDDGAVELGLWYLELSNVLLPAEKRSRVTTGDVTMWLAHRGIADLRRSGDDHPGLA